MWLRQSLDCFFCAANYELCEQLYYLSNFSSISSARSSTSWWSRCSCCNNYGGGSICSSGGSDSRAVVVEVVVVVAMVALVVFIERVVVAAAAAAFIVIVPVFNDVSWFSRPLQSSLLCHLCNTVSLTRSSGLGTLNPNIAFLTHSVEALYQPWLYLRVICPSSELVETISQLIDILSSGPLGPTFIRKIKLIYTL